MKFTINFKDPDGFSDGLAAAVDATRPAGLTEAEWEAVREVRMEEAKAALERWVEFQEYLAVEFDTDAGTATVVPQ